MVNNTTPERGYFEGPEILMGVLFVALLGLLGYGIYAEVQDNRAWAVWASQHACKVIGHMEGSVSTGVGPSTGGNGGVAIVTTSVPGKIGYQCDDGQQYWRNE